jgi:hypothetical protein
MSRSYRHSPIAGFGAKSEKKDKRVYNQKLRAKNKQLINSVDDYDDLIMLDISDVSDPWSMAKDGKGYFNKPTEQDSEFYQEYYQKFLRK